MYNYYIFPPSYTSATLGELEGNLKTLNILTCVGDELDHFIIDDTFWETLVDGSLDMTTALFSCLPDKQFRTSVLPKLLSKLQYHQKGYESIEDLNSIFEKMCNALWGIRFIQSNSHCLTNVEDYKVFRKKSICKIVPNDLFKHQKQIFKNIVVTQEAEKQILSYGTGKYYQQIIEHLIITDGFVDDFWQTGSFNLEKLKQCMDVSDESDSVKHNSKLSSHRYFNLPIGGVHCFLHIKFGDIRIHFYPNDSNRKIYIAYVGTHLPL